MPARRTLLLVGAGVAACALAVAAIAAGRGDRSGDGWRERTACLVNERAEARYLVVRAAYEWGVLGPRAEVVGSVHPKARDAIFLAGDELREWEEMEPAARHEFVEWATGGDVYARTKDAQTRATAAVTREDCE